MTTQTISKNSTDNLTLKTVQETLSVLEKFSALLVSETDALRRSDFQTLDTLQADKRQYAAAYHDLVVRLSERGEDMRSLDVSLKQKLVEARTEFTLILKDNMRALELMKASTQRLANRILEVARSSVTAEQQTSYSSGGKMQSYASSTRSLSLDHNL